MSNEAALGIKQNNEKLMKNITKLGDISILYLIFRQSVDSCSKIVGFYKAKNVKK